MRYICFISLLMIANPGALSGPNEPQVGFTAKQAEDQLNLEARFDKLLDPKLAEEWMHFLTSRPHHAGSAKAKENAEYVAELMTKWGFEVEIEVFDVLLPIPKKRALSLVAPHEWSATLTEPIMGEDIDQAEGLPPFNAFSADGNVTAELVYVNRGLPADYLELERRGIDVKGKIVLTRYYGSWRGIKPKLAAEKGAIGCLIFNDPHDDGFYQGETWPDGAYKHSAAVQRGSVLDLPVRPGDPLTPGYGAVPGAKRLNREDADNVMKIPVLPISFEDAQPLMAALRGPMAPPTWRGSMPLTYRVGPGPAVVNLELTFDWQLRPAYNVIAKLKGQDLPDRWVVRGNHHDAWVIGANDPISGLVGLMAEARAVGLLAKQGWQPKRTLVYCAWDAEEPALLGSTEWVEHHRDTLREKMVTYINSDSNSRGFLYAGGSHALERMLNQAANKVNDPRTGDGIVDRHRSRTLVSGGAKARQDMAQHAGYRLGALGSGSDYSAFLQHLGLPCLNVGFGGEGNGGEYHTAFDNFEHYTRFKDPGLAYSSTLASMCGRLTLRLSQAHLLPFDYRATAREINTYTDEVMALLKNRRQEADRINSLIDGRHYARAADPNLYLLPPKRRAKVPYLNFASLQNASQQLRVKANQLGRALDEVWSSGSLDPKTLAALNRLMVQGERALTDENGLPGRPWFQHLIYAPGLYTGYGVKTLPGVREAIEQDNWEEAGVQIERTSEAINRLSGVLDEALGLLGQ